MKRIAALSFLIVMLTFVGSAFAQPTEAQDFTLNDCSGTEHNLFSKLDNGDVVIMEFAMTCGACSNVRKKLATIESKFASTHPGKLHVYLMAYSNSYTCGNMQSWLSSNNITTTVFTGTKSIMDYYGPFGMPTTVVVGGKDRKVLYIDTDGSPNYNAIEAAISQVLTAASVPDHYPKKSITVIPNPSSTRSTLAVVCEKEFDAEVVIFNSTGVKVQSVFSGRFTKGSNDLEIVTDILTNGTYYIHVTRDGKTDIVPLTVTH